MLVCETVYSHNDTITYKCLFSSKKIRKKERKESYVPMLNLPSTFRMHNKIEPSPLPES
jgi:hypothetical protein